MNTIYRFGILFGFILISGVTNAQLRIAPVEYDGFWGYMNTDGTWFVEPKYEPSHEKGGLGRVLTEGSDGLIRLRQNESDSYVNVNGNPEFTLELGPSRDFSEKRAVVWTPGGLGIINTKGEFLLQPTKDYYEIREFKYGRAVAQSSKTILWGHIDQSGHWLVEPKFKKVWDWNEKVGRVKNQEGFNYIDENGQLLLEKNAQASGEFINGMSWFRYKEKGSVKIQFMTNQGVIVTPEMEVLKVMNYEENLCAFKSSNLKWGYMDTLGKLAIEPNYQYCRGFSQGFAAVYQNSSWIFIDSTGSPLPGLYDSVKDFHKNIAAVRKNRRWGFIDDSGKLIVDFQYENVVYPDKKYPDEHLIGVCKSYRCGYIDVTGELKIEPMFLEVRGFNAGMAMVETPKKIILSDGQKLRRGWTYIDTSGTPLVLEKGLHLLPFFEVLMVDK